MPESVWLDTPPTHFDVVVQQGMPTYPHEPIEVGDYNETNYSGDGGSINSADLSADVYADIAITELGWIQKGDGAVTKLCLRSSRDISVIATNDKHEDVDPYGSGYGEGYGPKLVVGYTIPNSPRYATTSFQNPGIF